MCILTTAIVGAALAAVTSTVSTVMATYNAVEQNKAIEKQYQYEVDVARQKAVYEQNRVFEETLEKTRRNAQESRDDALEGMRTASESEAAMSALNIAGNTSVRQVGVADVTQIRREGAYAENEDVIGVQHLMSQLGIKQQYEWEIDEAKSRAKSQWQNPGLIALKGWLYDIPTAGVQGAIGGASLGSMFGGGGGSAGYQMPSFQRSVAGAPGTAFGVSRPTVPTLASPAGGAFGMALA